MKYIEILNLILRNYEHNIQAIISHENIIPTSGNSLSTASSAAALALSILDWDDADAPKQETWTNLTIPPCSLAICTYNITTLPLKGSGQ